MSANKISVLDHGHLTLVDTMGSDKSVVNAARVSYANADWMNSELSEKDSKLITYLADHKHVSPFYHPHVSFVIKAPISVQRQAVTHKIGTAVNSESTRYTEVAREFYVPDQYRLQSKKNKQGSDGEFSATLNEMMRSDRNAAYDYAWDQYAYEISVGVSRELARDVLPLGVYTSWFWTLSLAAVAHFIRLRDEDHAQHEIRVYAKAMRELVEPLFPVSLPALLK